jgi:hypothetical protein
MKQPLLVIFVDALPYDRAINMVNSLNAKTYSKSVPGAGYSINVKAEMFAGLKPDDVGYFCEWNYDADASVSWPVRALMPVLEFFGGISHFADRVLHKLITKVLGENVYAIPYRVLPFLKNSGLTAYERDFQFPTFLSEGGFERVLYSEEGVIDKKVFEKASSRLQKEKCSRLFVSTAQLDGVMHNYGMFCDEYENQIKVIEEHAVNLINDFMAIHGEDARYFLFSDHGMAPVLEGVDFDIRKSCGKPGHNSYLYCVDATFYRVWLNDKGLESKVIESFNEVKDGHILTDKEREKFGLVDRKHGDVIFMLDESKQFAPNFFGRDICQAMHGYDPQLDSQLGAYISNIDGTHGEKIDAVDIHRSIKNII